MTLSPAADQGRNGASLNLGDALGSGVFVGISGSIFAALQAGGNLSLTFGAVMAAMTLVATAALLASLRIGSIGTELRPDR